MWKKIFFYFFITILVFISSAYADDIKTKINYTSSVTWTTYLVNYFSTWNVSLSWTYYYNKDNNSDVIGDYFWWYYYNTWHWFFKMDWDLSGLLNVKIQSTTNLCPTYWYKLSWLSKGNSWYVNFSYNSGTFVYYCLDDWKLHWKAYSKIYWLQNFEWIKFPLKDKSSVTLLTWASIPISDTIFLNDTSPFLLKDYLDKDKNWEKKSIKYWSESIFYIFKPKK